MEISYKDKKIERVCTNVKASDKKFGQEMSEKIQMRLDEIRAADSVEEMVMYRIGRCHPLVNNRKGQYAVDLVHPYRLVFEKVDGKIQLVVIIEIVDYH